MYVPSSAATDRECSELSALYAFIIKVDYVHRSGLVRSP